MVLKNRRKARSPLTIEHLPPASFTPNPKNARRHSAKQIAKLSQGIHALGFNVPIVIDEDSVILAGHARWEAAKHLRLEQVPCVRLLHLSAPQKIAFAVADNRLPEEATWDNSQLQLLFKDLMAVDFDLDLTGFETPEIDFYLDAPTSAAADPADDLEEPDPNQQAVSQSEDLWRLGPHRLICGNALQDETYVALLGDIRAQMVFADAPYNVPVQGHVSGLGKVRHREFAMASGEMSDAAFCDFLAQISARLVQFSTSGSIHYLCMDWRSIDRLIQAGRTHYSELKNICVWVKPNGGMGSLYRSQHELVAVFKSGTEPHQNNVELGKHGRYRTNCWEYAGANSFSRTRDADLASHPTPKPISLVSDAILDVTKPGWLVLDPFMGSGTTIMAAERTGRRAAGIEIDPLYVDTAIRRWQAKTGQEATLDGDGRTFAEVEADRSAEPTLELEVGA